MRTGFLYIGGRVVSALLASIGWVFNARDVGGQSTPWWVLVVVGALSFLVLTVGYEVSLYRQMHSVEQAAEIEVQPDSVGTDLQWLNWHADGARHVTSADISMYLSIRNPTSIPRSVSKVYVELTNARTFWRRRPRAVLRVKPFIIGTESKWYARPEPEVVDWEIPVGGKTFREKVFFAEQFSGVAKGPRIGTEQASFFLVIEFGSREHQVRRELHLH